MGTPSQSSSAKPATASGYASWLPGASMSSAKGSPDPDAPVGDGWLSGALKWVGMDQADAQDQRKTSVDATESMLDREHQRRAEMIQQIVNLGFTEEQASHALKRASSVEAAVEWILQSGGA